MVRKSIWRVLFHESEKKMRGIRRLPTVNFHFQIGSAIPLPPVPVHFA